MWISAIRGRPKTCLEVDFPILFVNQVAAIEGNAGKTDLSDVEMVGAPTIERVPSDADRSGDASPG